MAQADGHPKPDDRQACEAFIREEYEGLHRWFYWMTRDPERSADLTQETFAGFWHSLGRVVPTQGPRVWLYAIARNIWRKHCRQRHRHRREEAEMTPDEVKSTEPGPFANLENREFAEALSRTVAGLPAEYREVFTLRVWQELEYEQIAEVQGISRDLARWRFFRARQLVRAQMQSWQLQEEHHAS